LHATGFALHLEKYNVEQNLIELPWSLLNKLGIKKLSNDQYFFFQPVKASSLPGI
jgi:hypothetical protein